MKKAVILFNLGGPDKLENVEPFLFNLFNDPAILNLPSFFRFPLAKLISKIYECSLHVSDEYFINKTDNQYMSEDFYFMNLFKKSTEAIIENRITEIIKYTEHKDNQIEYLG